MQGDLFNAEAFALEVRLGMARQNVSFRELADLTGTDQANIHRVAKHAKCPSVETFLRLRRWLDGGLPPHNTLEGLPS